MSYNTWHIYGYGIIVDDIETNFDKIMDLVSKSPYFKREFIRWLDDYSGDIPLYEDCLEYESDSGVSGLGAIIQNVILEAEQLYFVVSENYDGVQYLMFPQGYPWSFGQKEKNITENDIKKILIKYISILTDEPIDIGYLECENGG